MTDPAPLRDPVPDPRALLTELGARVLEREGIPMFLALQNPSLPANGPEDPPAEGVELAGLLRHYREVLVPEAEDGAEPALIDVLQVMGAAHLTPSDARTGKETTR